MTFLVFFSFAICGRIKGIFVIVEKVSGKLEFPLVTPVK